MPRDRQEVLRRTETNWSFQSMVTMFCLLTPLNTAPITTFFHDFSGYEFSSLDRELLGYGVNFALAPPSAFNIDPYSGWKADWFTFKRGLHRHAQLGGGKGTCLNLLAGTYPPIYLN